MTRFQRAMVMIAFGAAGCGAPEEGALPPETAEQAEEGLAVRDRARAPVAVQPVGPVGPVAPVNPVPPPVVNGTFTTTPNWVVQIQHGGCSCSGWALNEHWILTSAHCFRGSQACPASVDGDQVTVRRATGLGTNAIVYQAPASFIRHPSFNDTATHDAQLIRLWSHGLPIDMMGNARMYSDTRRPWKDPSLPRTFSVSGWGRSVVDPNDATNCIAGGINALRTGGPMTMDSTSTDVPSFVSAAIGTQFACSGDSGTPWLLDRSGELLGFAIHSRRVGSPRKMQGTTIADNLTWIEDTLKANVSANRYGQWCHDGTAGDPTSGYYRYRQCEELWRGWGQLARDSVCIQADGSAAGSGLHAATCGVSTSIATQAFALVPSGEILSLAAPGFCLEASSAADLAPLKVAPCNGSLNQRFGNSPAGELRLGLDWSSCVTSVRQGPWDVIDDGPGVLAPADAPEEPMVVADEVGAAQTTAPAVATSAASFPALWRASILARPCNGSASQRWTVK